MEQPGSSSAAQTKRTRPALLSRDQTFVTINIDGDDNDEGPQTYMLHRESLCSQSPYFAAAFKSEFRESKDRSISIRGVTASTMRLFQFWLYGRSTVWSVDCVGNQSTPKSESAKDEKAGEEPTAPVSAPPKPWSKAADWVATEEFLFQKRHRYLETFVSLYLFADFYNTPQLRNDVMTLSVELAAYNNHNNGCLDVWTTTSIRRLYRNLPSTSPLCRYAVTRRAVHPGGASKDAWGGYPKSFLIDVLSVAMPMKGVSTKRKLQEELCDSCNFHEHKGDKEAIAVCKTRQQKEGLWFSSFLRACMSEVYDMEDAMLESKSHAQTEEKPKDEPDTLEKKEDKAIPFSAGVGLPSDSTFSFTIPRGVDGRSQMEPPVSNWEDLEAYDGYEILLHGG